MTKYEIPEVNHILEVEEELFLPEDSPADYVGTEVVKTLAAKIKESGAEISANALLQEAFASKWAFTHVNKHTLKVLFAKTGRMKTCLEICRAIEKVASKLAREHSGVDRECLLQTQKYFQRLYTLGMKAAKAGACGSDFIENLFPHANIYNPGVKLPAHIVFEEDSPAINNKRRVNYGLMSSEAKAVSQSVREIMETKGKITLEALIYLFDLAPVDVGSIFGDGSPDFFVSQMFGESGVFKACIEKRQGKIEHLCEQVARGVKIVGKTVNASDVFSEISSEVNVFIDLGALNVDALLSRKFESQTPVSVSNGTPESTDGALPMRGDLWRFVKDSSGATPNDVLYGMRFKMSLEPAA